MADTVTVPVDPIQSSTRGWFNIGQALLGAVAATPAVQGLIAGNPLIAAGASILFGLVNWFLLKKSKAGVVSKNVVVN